MPSSVINLKLAAFGRTINIWSPPRANPLAVPVTEPPANAIGWFSSIVANPNQDQLTIFCRDTACIERNRVVSRKRRRDRSSGVRILVLKRLQCACPVVSMTALASCGATTKSFDRTCYRPTVSNRMSSDICRVRFFLYNSSRFFKAVARLHSHIMDANKREQVPLGAYPNYCIAT